MPYQFQSVGVCCFFEFASDDDLPLPELGRGVATECVGKPDLSVSQTGHWHYHIDRASSTMLVF
jgi:hypothetical protein